ncbi:restriction endonuclease [bacterium]|nr:MAG: restriction endonuclease [bacterium]
MSNIGSVGVYYTASGLTRYQVEVSHPNLNKYQLFKGDDRGVVEARARAKGAEWDEQWAKRSAVEAKRQQREAAAKDVESKKRLAAEQTGEAVAAQDALKGLLAHTLGVNDAIDWESLKDTSAYPVAKPKKAPAPPAPVEIPAPPEPLRTDLRYKPKMGLLDYLSGTRKQARIAEAEQLFNADHAGWVQSVEQLRQQHLVNTMAHTAKLKQDEEDHVKAVESWQRDEEAFRAQQAGENASIDKRRAEYEAGDPEAVTDYCGMVLDNSAYPDCFPQDYELEYNPANKILLVDYQLPSPADLPTTAEVKYVASKDEFAVKTVSDRQLNQTYDDMLYQVALRTLHELFEADVIEALASVNFNGWVKSVDRATGQSTESCVLSIQVQRDEFLGLDLSLVDPKACFKKLKGVCAAKLHALTPVAPLLTMSREDSRFVSSYAVADTLTEGDNLAAMDWEDFEHLIRELFEKEFASAGAEVKVTQASRDGGVDAVIFNPNPIHGGKTVVQAKRYTNTVGVSAVRDLYGTMMNEGANKGILVTTSDFGPDAYAFANGKPLVLLSGSNLLHLLASHGHKARIDLQEAKLLAGEANG